MAITEVQAGWDAGTPEKEGSAIPGSIRGQGGGGGNGGAAGVPQAVAAGKQFSSLLGGGEAGAAAGEAGGLAELLPLLAL